MASVASRVFIALPPATAKDYVIFGKNLVRPVGEVQEVIFLPAADHSSGSTVKCTYSDLEQSGRTNAVILSRSTGSWGAEMGANELGVCIGCSLRESSAAIDKGFTGQDLVRLGLERGSDAYNAVHVITDVIDVHGLGGVNSSVPPSAAPGIGFIICDRTETWVLEVCGKQWVAQKLTSGVWCLAGQFTIGSTFDECSSDLKDYAVQHQLWSPDDGDLDFAKTFSTQSVAESQDSEHRFQEFVDNASGSFSLADMLEVLRHPDYESCVDGHVVAGSQVSVLPPAAGDAGGNQPLCVHWLTATPRPSVSFFKPFVFAGVLPTVCDKTTASAGADGASIVAGQHLLWSAHRRLLDRLEAGDSGADSVAKNMRDLERNCCEDVDELMQTGSGAEPSVAGGLFEHMVNLEINFY